MAFDRQLFLERYLHVKFCGQGGVESARYGAEKTSRPTGVFGPQPRGCAASRLLMTLYATGMRRSELACLKGKGGKDRNL
jgi:hypothetical protein